MRIILVNKFYYLKGGAERYFLNLKKLLEQKNHEVALFAMQDKRNFPSKYSKYFVSRVDLEKSGYSIKKACRVLYSFKAKKKFDQLIRDFKPDIIHIHNIYHQISPSILTVAKKHNIPIVQTLHDFKLICPNYSLYSKNTICEQCKKYRYYKCVFRKCIKNKFWPSLVATKEMYFHKLIKIYENNVGLFLAPSQFVRDKILQWGIIKEKQITVLPEFIFPYEKPNTLAHGIYILYSGRLIKGKGITTLVSAMKNIKNIELHIAGKGPLEEELRGLVKKENINNVKFLGFLNLQKLQQQILNSQFTIHPSKMYETFGLSILESYNLGKPVIAANLGAFKEIVQHKKTGLLFKAGNINDLTSKINYLLQNKDLISRMGENAKYFTHQKFNPEDHYQKLMKIYQSMI